QATIEKVIAVVADHIQQPDEAPGPAAPFIVVDHVGGACGVAQLGEQALQFGFAGEQAGSGRLTQLGALAVDPAGPADVPLGIAGGATEVDQNQLGGIQATGQIGGFYHQAQVAEG